MSDLFAPMPLPDRPVQQTADIAEREAAAQNREIDTRMRERLETGRQKMIYEFEVVKQTEKEAKYKAELDRQIASAKPFSMVRNIGRVARRSHQNRQVSQGDQGYNVEKGRLDAQQMSAKLFLGRLVNGLKLQAVQENWDPDKSSEAFQQQALQWFDSNVYFSEESSLASATRVAMQSMNKLFVDSALDYGDSTYDIALDRAVNNQEANIWSAVQEHFTAWGNGTDVGSPDDEPDILGLGTAFRDDPTIQTLIGALDDNRQYINQSIFEPGTQLHRVAASAIVTRLATGAFQEFATSVETQGLYGTIQEQASTHLHQAMEVINDSPLFKSTQIEFGIKLADVRKVAQSKIDAWKAVKSQEQVEARREHHDEWIDGAFVNESPASMLTTYRELGYPEGEAVQMSIEHGIQQEDQPWNGQAIQKAKDERISERQAEYELTLTSALVEWPEYLGDSDGTQQELQRLVRNGSLPASAVPRLMRLQDQGYRALRQEYAGAFHILDDWVATIANDRNMQERWGDGQGGLFPQYEDGVRHRSLLTLRQEITNKIEQKISAGEESGTERLTPDGMEEWVRREVVRAGSTMKLTKNTRDNLSGLQAEARPLEMTRIQPLPGAAEASAGSLVDYNAGNRQEFDALSPDRRLSYAVNSIPLTGYRGDAGDTAIHNENISVLTQAAKNGQIRAFTIDPTVSKAYIQLAEDGAWVVRDLDASRAVQLADNLRGNLEAIEDVELEVEDTIGMGEGKLFHNYTHPLTGLSTPYPTEAAQALIANVENISITAREWVRLIREQGSGALAGLDLSALANMTGGAR